MSPLTPSFIADDDSTRSYLGEGGGPRPIVTWWVSGASYWQARTTFTWRFSDRYVVDPESPLGLGQHWLWGDQFVDVFDSQQPPPTYYQRFTSARTSSSLVPEYTEWGAADGAYRLTASPETTSTGVLVQQEAPPRGTFYAGEEFDALDEFRFSVALDGLTEVRHLSWTPNYMLDGDPPGPYDVSPEEVEVFLQDQYPGYALGMWVKAPAGNDSPGAVVDPTGTWTRLFRAGDALEATPDDTEYGKVVTRYAYELHVGREGESPEDPLDQILFANPLDGGLYPPECVGVLPEPWDPGTWHWVEAYWIPQGGTLYTAAYVDGVLVAVREVEIPAEVSVDPGALPLSIYNTPLTVGDEWNGNIGWFEFQAGLTAIEGDLPDEEEEEELPDPTGEDGPPEEPLTVLRNSVAIPVEVRFKDHLLFNGDTARLRAVWVEHNVSYHGAPEEEVQGLSVTVDTDADIDEDTAPVGTLQARYLGDTGPKPDKFFVTEFRAPSFPREFAVLRVALSNLGASGTVPQHIKLFRVRALTEGIQGGRVDNPKVL